MKTLVLWAAFFIGQMVYVLMRASWAIRSKGNPVQSRRQFFYIWWDVIVVRALIEVAIFWLYCSYPTVLTDIAGKFGMSWNLTVPTVPPVAFFIGLTADAMLDFVLGRFPFFQKEIPHLPPIDNGTKDQSIGKGAGE